MADNARFDDCNHAVLAFLAARQTLKFSVDAIRAKVNRDGGDYSWTEIRDALEFLEGKRLVEMSYDDLGAMPYFQATSDGVLHWRRNL